MGLSSLYIQSFEPPPYHPGLSTSRDLLSITWCLDVRACWDTQAEGPSRSENVPWLIICSVTSLLFRHDDSNISFFFVFLLPHNMRSNKSLLTWCHQYLGPISLLKYPKYNCTIDSWKGYIQRLLVQMLCTFTLNRNKASHIIFVCVNINIFQGYREKFVVFMS